MTDKPADPTIWVQRGRSRRGYWISVTGADRDVIELIDRTVRRLNRPIKRYGARSRAASRSPQSEPPPKPNGP